MKNLLFVVLIMIGLVVLYFIRLPELNEYNAHMCRTWGYEADCKTPIGGKEVRE